MSIETENNKDKLEIIYNKYSKEYDLWENQKKG